MLADDDTKNSIMQDVEETNFEAVFGIFRSQQLDSNTEETSFYICKCAICFQLNCLNSTMFVWILFTTVLSLFGFHKHC